MNRETAEFVIYIINAVANRKGISTSQVYAALQKTDCINGYLAPCYDVLHTMGSQSVVEDVLEFVQTRGESL